MKPIYIGSFDHNLQVIGNQMKRSRDNVTEESTNVDQSRRVKLNDDTRTVTEQAQSEFRMKTTVVRLDTSTCPITGEKRHDYYVDGQKVGKEEGFYGVTTFINTILFNAFDPESALSCVFNSKRYTSDPSYQYYKQTREEILKQWDDSAINGSDLHDRIDRFLTTCNKDLAFGKDKYSDIPLCLMTALSVVLPAPLEALHFFSSESALLDRELKMTGTIDALFYNTQTGRYILIDWKSNSVKTRSYGTKGIAPSTSKFDDTKYYRYYCQLNIYATILKRSYGIICEKLIVIGFGLDKRIPKDVSHKDRMVSLARNMDIHEIPIDHGFQSKFVAERLQSVVH